MLSKGFGGGERYFFDLTVALAEAGYTVQALCHRKFVGLDDLRSVSGVRVDTANALGMWEQWSINRLARAASDFSPDVIHSHFSRGAWAGGRIAMRCECPLVVTMHNYVKLKYYRSVNSIIPTTSDQESYLLASGIDPSRISRIPNFSSVPAVESLPPAATGPLRLLSYGRMVEKKGFKVLLKAFSAALDDGIDATLTLGGDGPQREETVALAQDLGLSDRVRFVGWIDDVAAALDASDVFVLPSLDEPFGIVMLEAMARGKPIITTRSKGPSEVLDDATAYFAEIGDDVSLKNALVEAASDPNGRTAKAALALQVYREQYHRDAVVPRITALYSRLVAETHAA